MKTLPETFVEMEAVKIYTIKDIAKKAGVGISTVSRVLNNRPDVNEDTRDKILNIIKEFNYIQNNNAKHLKQRSTKCISVIVRGKQNMFFAGIIEKMQKYINDNEYQFVIEYIEETENEFDVAKKLYAERKIEGIIFLGGDANEKREEIKNLKIPCVYSTVAAQKVNLSYVSSVSIDDRKVTKTAVDYLFDNGHRKIAIIGSVPNSDDSIGLRFQGVLDSFKEHNMKFDRRYYIESNFLIKPAYMATKGAFDRLTDVTAIFAMSDTMAIGAAKAVIDSGLRIPEDISIIGFDGIELAAYYNPTITTIRQPADLIAQKSVELIVENIKSGEGAKHILVDAELVVGSSVKNLNTSH